MRGEKVISIVKRCLNKMTIKANKNVYVQLPANYLRGKGLGDKMAFMLPRLRMCILALYSNDLHYFRVSTWIILLRQSILIFKVGVISSDASIV